MKGRGIRDKGKMDSNKEHIVQGLRKAIEFYEELGFEYIPLRSSDVSGVPVNTQDKERLLKELRDRIGDCHRCKLSKSRTNIVFGEGDPYAKLMFVGEGPGREEDIQARPFVGDAGRVLTSLIIKMGLRRGEVYIANIVKCRPPYNRNPEEDEIITCKPFLEEQIEIIKPRVIFSLGKISAQALLGVNIPISKMRGHFYNYRNIPVMPTFHPAYLLRNPADKWLTWDDAQKVLETLKSSNKCET